FRRSRHRELNAGHHRRPVARRGRLAWTRDGLEACGPLRQSRGIAFVRDPGRERPRTGDTEKVLAPRLRERFCDGANEAHGRTAARGLTPRLSGPYSGAFTSPKASIPPSLRSTPFSKPHSPRNSGGLRNVPNRMSHSARSAKL